jgi:hypothetical protein
MPAKEASTRRIHDAQALRTAAGWLFENYAHVVLSDPNRDPLPIYIRNETGAPSIPPPMK